MAFRRDIGQDAERLWYLALSIACALIFFSAIVSAAAVSPRFCSLCHSSEAESLSESPHRGTACDKCHAKAGVAGVIDSRLAVVGMIPAQLVAVGRPGPATVNNEQCLACHRNILTGITTSKGLRISHAALEAEKWSCTRCHPRTAHIASTPVTGYTMDMCIKCHTPNATNLKLCDMCHVGGSAAVRQVGGATTPWRVTHGPNWRLTHGMGDLSTCVACHPDGYCARCHNMDIPHPPDFPATHGKAVLDRDNGTTDCLFCHRQSTCDNCHGIAMPHPAGFLKRHPKTVVTVGEKRCVRCHEKEACLDCHAKHLHPGLAPEVIQKLRSRPAR